MTSEINTILSTPTPPSFNGASPQSSPDLPAVPSPSLPAIERLDPNRVRIGEVIKTQVLQYTPYLIRAAIVILIAAAILGPLFAFGITIPVLPAMMISGISFSYFFTGAVVLASVSLLVYTAIRLIKFSLESDQKKLQQGLTTATINALTADANLEKRIEEQTGKHCKILQKCWKQLINKKDFSSLQAFYRAFDDVYDYAYAGKHINDESLNPLRELLKTISKTLIENVDGLPVYRDYGKQICGGETPQTYQAIAEFFRKYASPSFASLNRNSKLNYLFWVTLYPEYAMESVRCRFAGANYRTSMECGNIPSRIWEFNSNGQTIHALVGPGTFDPVLESYYCDSVSSPLLLIGMQDHSKKGEGPRVDRLLGLPDSAKERRFTCANIPVDGKSWKTKPEGETAPEFIANYIQELKQATGYRGIDRKVQQQASEMVQTLFKNIPITSANTEMIKYTFLAVLSLGMLQQAFDDNPKDIEEYTRIACKQSIDRGSTMSCAVNLLYHLAKGDLLTNPTILHEILGVLLGRARLVENRLPIEHRIDPFLQMVDFIFSDDQRATLLGAALREQFSFTQPVAAF